MWIGLGILAFVLWAVAVLLFDATSALVHVSLAAALVSLVLYFVLGKRPVNHT